MIDARNTMMLNAGRDVVIASQTATHNAKNSSTTNISRITSVQIGAQAVMPNKVAANTTAGSTIDGSTQAGIGGSSLEKASSPDVPPNDLLVINVGRNATLITADIQNNAQGGQTFISA